MIFVLLPAGKLHKKPEKLKLKTLPAGYIERFYRNLPDDVYIILGSDFMGRLQMIMPFLLTVFKNTSSQRMILQKECRQKLIIM